MVAEEEEEDLPLVMMGMVVDPQVMMGIEKAVVVAERDHHLVVLQEMEEMMEMTVVMRRGSGPL